MEITISDFGDLAKRVTLIGRLDIPGAGKIDMPSRNWQIQTPTSSST
jgi:hypothetical protein